MLGQDAIFAHELHTVNRRSAKLSLQDSKEHSQNRTAASEFQLPRDRAESDLTIRPKAFHPTRIRAGMTREREEDTEARLLMRKRVRPDGIEKSQHMRFARWQIVNDFVAQKQ